MRRYGLNTIFRSAGEDMPEEHTPRCPESSRHPVTVEAVVVAHNEEEALPESIPELCAFLATHFPYRWMVTIADSASTDRTLDVAMSLADEEPYVSVVRLDEKGRSTALKTALLESTADVLICVEADLLANQGSFPPLVASLVDGRRGLGAGPCSSGPDGSPGEMRRMVDEAG